MRVEFIIAVGSVSHRSVTQSLGVLAGSVNSPTVVVVTTDTGFSF